MSTEAQPRNLSLVERNIQALLDKRGEEERALGWQERLAGAISAFAGSMTFVWIHLLAYGSWIGVNLGLVPGIRPFDPTFVGLAMVASVEAIFLSTFILISQNRMQAQADRRDELNLQISLLAEHEITRLMKIVSEIGEKLDAPSARHPEVEEMQEDVRPEDVLDVLDKRTGAAP
jgi:uncharacterized membrane protein